MEISKLNYDPARQNIFCQMFDPRIARKNFGNLFLFVFSRLSDSGLRKIDV